MPQMTRSGVDKARVFIIKVCIDAVERDVKSKGVSKTQDVDALAQSCFAKLKEQTSIKLEEQMKYHKELNPVCLRVALAGFKIFFFPSESIAKDLKRYQEDPSASVEPLTWNGLCNLERELYGENYRIGGDQLREWCKELSQVIQTQQPTSEAPSASPNSNKTDQI